MKNLCLFCLLASFSYIFSGCGLSDLLEPIDEPPRSSKLKGPKQAELETQTIEVSKIVDFPFKGSVRQYGSHYLLSGYAGQGNRYALIESGNVVEIPFKPLREIFLDQAGGVWGLTTNGTQETISQYTNGRWQDYAVLSDDGYFYSVVDTKPTEFRFATSKGTMVWDVQQKTVKQIIPTEQLGLLTQNHLIRSDGETITLYNNLTQQSIASWKFSDYVVTKKGIINRVWSAFEDNQGAIWMVVKDGNWDGVLLKYDGSTLQKLSLIPVGSYDSGRFASNLHLDKKGNLWLDVDNVDYIYTKAGKWVQPEFNSINEDSYPTFFSDGQGNLTLTEGLALYSIDQ